MMMMTLLLFYLPHRIDVDESHGTIPHRIVHDRKQQLAVATNNETRRRAGAYLRRCGEHMKIMVMVRCAPFSDGGSL